jgi:hypothetical protein
MIPALEHLDECGLPDLLRFVGITDKDAKRAEQSLAL